MSLFEGVKQWIEENTKDASISYVPLPVGGEEEDLERFEREFAKKILESMEEFTERVPDVQEISWEKIGRKIMEAGR